MNILFISALSSARLIDKIHKETGANPGYAIQKFNRLIVLGLLENGQEVKTLTNPPVVGLKKNVIGVDSEIENGILYQYVPYFPTTGLKSFIVFFYTFFYVLIWGCKDRKNKAIICDALSIGACLGALMATKINRIKSVGIVTDMPSCILSKGKITFKQKFNAWVNMSYIKSFTHYVFLTRQIDKLINVKKRPFIVMESICETSITDEELSRIDKTHPPVILYAGGLNYRNGVKLLTESFIEADINAKLVIYGDGQYAAELKEISKANPKVVYKGLASNDVVVKEEFTATLLVNPRYLGEEYTKYSYPSKNMEFMASGTPLLTSKLPGIPEDHFSYIYTFDEISQTGYVNKLRELFALDSDELKKFGRKARHYVLERKNYKVQSKRIIDLISK